MAPDRKFIIGTAVMNDSLNNIPTSTTRDKIRGVCAYLGNLSRYNTPNKYQPCPVPPGSGCSPLLRYSRKRKKPEAVVDSSGKLPCRKLDDQSLDANAKSKVATDKEPCLCSATTAVDSVSNRQRLSRRKNLAKPKTPGNDSASIDNKINSHGSHKLPENGTAPPPPPTPRSVILRQDRRNLNSFVRAVVKPVKDPIWCETTKIINDSKTSKASTLRYSKKADDSDANRSSKMAKNKVIKVLWHATNYTDPE